MMLKRLRKERFVWGWGGNLGYDKALGWEKTEAGPGFQGVAME